MESARIGLNRIVSGGGYPEETGAWGEETLPNFLVPKEFLNLDCATSVSLVPKDSKTQVNVECGEISVVIEPDREGPIPRLGLKPTAGVN